MAYAPFGINITCGLWGRLVAFKEESSKQTLLPDEQAMTITVDNVEGLLPEQTHAFGQGQLHMSYMTDKWIMKYLKQYPNITTYKELMEVSDNG